MTHGRLRMKFVRSVFMSNYIPWLGKKRQQLAIREGELLEALTSETNMSKLKEAAERVRAAQVRAIKAKRAQLPPWEKNAIAAANLDSEVRFWLSISCDQIIEGYRSGKLCGHRSKMVKENRERRRTRSRS